MQKTIMEEIVQTMTMVGPIQSHTASEVAVDVVSCITISIKFEIKLMNTN